MRWAKAIGFLLISHGLLAAGENNSAKSIDKSLRHLELDPDQTYRVRDLRLTRGGVKVYLNDGVLSFVKPVAGRVVAAVFATEGGEAGDGEVLALPPRRSERASLASFTKSPNLNEHFGSAVFFFSDATWRECLGQLNEPRAAGTPVELPVKLQPALRSIYDGLGLDLVQALLDTHKEEDGFFFATFAGRELGVFDFLYEPRNPEPVSIGQTISGLPVQDQTGPGQATSDKTTVDKAAASNEKQAHFQLWSSYRPARSATWQPPSSRFSDYSIHADISPELRLAARAGFSYLCDESMGRTLRFDLSKQLRVTAAAIDGEPAEVLERQELSKAGQPSEAGAFLLISGRSLSPGAHAISISYEGRVIHQTSAQTYFVEERNTWYPHADTVLTNFDLTFQCPEKLELVSTGELVSDTTHEGIRTVHRRTLVPEGLAGFNLGEYSVRSESHGEYEVNVFANRTESTSTAELSAQTVPLLEDYSRRWVPLPFRSIAISPIPGYFGQGFPGLIYLSDVAYVRQKNRPASLRTPRMDSFFSDMLLPHEVAHQWWGNLVVPADYRSSWLTEALASYAALQHLEDGRGPAARESVLDQYRKHLLLPRENRETEAIGPVDFGIRLWDTGGKDAWQTITYEKGAWILHMLRARLGDARWRQAQIKLLTDFRSRPLSNDEFRQTIAALLPANQPDRTLNTFFDTWVYGTGLPELTLRRKSSNWEVEVSQVDDDFTVDIPLECHGSGATHKGIRWIRATAGTTDIPIRDNTRSCSLPSADQFLYRGADKS